MFEQVLGRRLEVTRAVRDVSSGTSSARKRSKMQAEAFQRIFSLSKIEPIGDEKKEKSEDEGKEEVDMDFDKDWDLEEHLQLGFKVHLHI